MATHPPWESDSLLSLCSLHSAWGLSAACVVLCCVPTGRCGAMKIMLADQGQEWKEVLVNFEDWMKGDLKATCVSGVFKGEMCNI